MPAPSSAGSLGAREGARPRPNITSNSSGCGGVSVGRNPGQPVSTSYQAPFEFTGGSITKVVVDVSGAPYIDAEKQSAVAFAKD